VASRRLALGSLVRAKTKIEAERVGKYMLRPILALDRLTFLEPEGKVGYRYGEKGAEQETMDYLEFIARVTSHIPDKGQVMVRYFGLYANAHRGKVKKASQSPTALRIVEEELRRLPSKGWAALIRKPYIGLRSAALIRKPHIGLRSAAMIRKVYEVDPMICPNSEASYRTAKRCPKCGGRMKVVAFLTEVAVVDRIIDHLELTFVADRPQPCSPHGFHEGRLRVFLSRSPCRRPLRPVLKETSLRLHECGFLYSWRQMMSP